MKRVLIFSTAYLPFLGGAEIAVKEITDRIHDTEFVLVTAKMDNTLPSRERVGNIDVHRIGNWSGWDKYRLVVTSARYAESLGTFDTVWAIMASYAGFAALRYKKKHAGTKFVLTLQEGDSLWDIYKHVWWCWPYFKQIFQKADRIQAISAYLADWAKRLGAFCPIAVIPNGVSFGAYGSPRHSDTTTVVTVSRLERKNGVDTLIRAMAHLPDATLEIVGDGSERMALNSLAARLGISSRVHFAGRMEPKEIPALLSSARVFCRPSRSEGLGNAFLEAMAAGVPVVGTPVGGIPDFLKDGDTGLVCRVDDPKDVAEKIKKIFDDASLSARLSENGRTLVAEQYEWHAIARKMSALL